MVTTTSVPSGFKWRPHSAYAPLGLMILAAWLPSLTNGFIWDDDSFLTENPLIHASDGLYRFWFTTQATDYWPVTSSALWLEWRLWGAHAAGYHLTNLVLHLGEAYLLWRILRRLHLPGAALAAVLFAVHPINVESVAWITEQKNLLALLFAELCVLAFLAGLIDGRSGRSRLILYALSLTAFAFALLSKASVAPLPLILTGVMVWQGKLTRVRFLRLVPFYLVATGLAAINVWFEIHRAGAHPRHVGMLSRTLGAAAAGWFYLGKALWPIDLSFNYPLWQIDSRMVSWWLPLLAAAAVTAGLGWVVIARRPARLTDAVSTLWPAWLYFWIMLLPVLGFAEVYFMKYSLVADHYEHLALIGITAALGVGWSTWFDRTRDTGSLNRRLPLAAAGLAVAALGFLTARQCRIYRDSESLYRATLSVNPQSWLAHSNLGTLLVQTGRLNEAIAEYNTAIALQPGNVQSENDLGAALARLGRPDDAMAHYQKALRLEPTFAPAEFNWGLALQDEHKLDLAEAKFAAAVRLDPRFVDAQIAYGTRLLSDQRYPEAIDHFRSALMYAPGSALAHCNLGEALLGNGRMGDAEAEEDQALKLDPNYAPAWVAKGLCLFQSGEPSRAIEHYRHALSIAPAYPEALSNWACALLRLNRPLDALEKFQAAQRLDPQLPDLDYNLGIASARIGRLEEAVQHFQAVLRHDPANSDARRKLSALLARLGRSP